MSGFISQGTGGKKGFNSCDSCPVMRTLTFIEDTVHH